MQPDPQTRRRDIVRGAVRGLLEGNAEFATLPPERRRRLAHDLVSLTETSLALMAEEAAVDPAAARTLAAATGADASPLAAAQEAPADFDPAANLRLGQIARDTLDGIAFPRFVTELVNGVFKGLIDANAQQIQAYVDMISGVTAASAGSASETGPDQARLWLLQQFPDAYELGASQDIWGEEESGTTVVRLREGREAPAREDVAAMLELEGEEAGSFDTEEPEERLLSKVRAYLSRKRQKVIASLLSLGINRLVIDHGMIRAGMNFSIDAHSAAEENRARRFEFRHSSQAGGSAGIGPWSVNASMTNSIGVVNTTQSHRREELNQQVNMNADVELHFHSDYLPLNQFAARDSVNRIRAVSANPSAPAATTPATRRAQRSSADRDAARRVAATPINIPGPGTPPPIHRPDANDGSAEARRRREQDRRQDQAARQPASGSPAAQPSPARPTPPASGQPAARPSPARPATPTAGQPAAQPSPARPATPAASQPAAQPNPAPPANPAHTA